MRGHKEQKICLHTEWRSIPQEAVGCAVALGNFDGVHLGHVHLIHAVYAARPDLPRAVVTFDPHPREFFRPQDPPFRLTLPQGQCEALEAVGIQHIFRICFDDNFAHMSAREFVNEVLHKALGVRHVGCGQDFAFGYRRGGGVSFLSEQTESLGIGFTCVSTRSDEGGPYSSTRIRRLLQDGYPEKAAEELGRPWSIQGKVQRGNQYGQKLGFPTANISLGRYLEPARGVYIVTVCLSNGEKYSGIANIGLRPTISDGQESRLEVHLFHFSGDLYGQQISVALHQLLRQEQRFSGLEALKAQIAQDVMMAQEILAASPKKLL
ncbi:MAG: bifunctional riboflavin kinase/FAD synthetase [Acetobacter sp.]|nr:bifunctional riboflavin kinase/FAD synthetase [Acetobacter sp.]